jgi:predicted ArsR family transcriptional regulator
MTDAWKAQTSAFDRVRSIAVTLDTPRNAEWISEEALVSENTARDHLERLVEMNVLQRLEERAVLYQPDPLYTRMRALRELLAEHDLDDLVALRSNLLEQTEEWQAEYDVEDADELRVLATQAASADETQTIRQTANDWSIVAYRLRLVDDAIEHYSEYTGSTPAPV